MPPVISGLPIMATFAYCLLMQEIVHLCPMLCAIGMAIAVHMLDSPGNGSSYSP